MRAIRSGRSRSWLAWAWSRTITAASPRPRNSQTSRAAWVFITVAGLLSQASCPSPVQVRKYRSSFRVKKAARRLWASMGTLSARSGRVVKTWARSQNHWSSPVFCTARWVVSLKP